MTSNSGDNCYVVHAHKFLIPYLKKEIFYVNSTEQDAVTLKLSNTATSPIVVEKIKDDTSNMADKFDLSSAVPQSLEKMKEATEPVPSTSAEVGL